MSVIVAFGNTKESKEEYRQFIRGLRLVPDEYLQLKRAFQGGFTHASPFFVDKIVVNVDSYDFTSSYPAVLVAEKFPMSCSQVVPIRSMRQLETNINQYCCLFDVEFIDIEATFLFDNYISASRCYHLEGEVLSNGRVVRAKRLITTITEQDYFIIRKTYRWKGNPRIGTFRRYERGYLPKPFVESVLDLYETKTRLKGVDKMIEEYNKAKEMANSCYGMSVTDPVRGEITYIENMWEGEREPDKKKPKIPPKDALSKAIRDYNNSYSRFLFYPWGIWVTAYARRNLWTAILETKSDHVYSDTDSEKLRNSERHRAYFERYNKMITADIIKACQHHGINPEKASPKTIKGKVKPLGVWDFDGSYSRFKTLGAKRYMVEYADIPENGENRGEINITVSGVNKKKAVPNMLKRYGRNKTTRKRGIFEAFTRDLTIPAKDTGKLIHTYIDWEINTVLTDFQGNPAEVHEKSVVHLEPSAYNLSMAQKFIDYITNLKAEWIE